ncbi:MAG: 1,2-phenylacetyl-CoA epoxidase subunit PaaC [Betaproteobacteria bacterium]|jgi:ring-1,2-phenylacetyl-CoA epoxidase subunit PaaC
MTPHFEYVLRLGDSALILGQRLAEMCGHGPVLEEDIALSNIALDLIGQARLLLTHAGRLEGLGRDEDSLAFLRPEGQFRNVTLVELPNGDFGRIVLRNLFFSGFHELLWSDLCGSRDDELAGIAAKSLKETRYHWRHAADWVIRLGDGTPTSHARMQGALEMLWPYTREFFATDAVDEAASRDGFGVDGAALEGAWSDRVRAVLSEATLSPPDVTPFCSTGRRGVHSEHMGHLLAEMQTLQRTYPGASW